MNNMNYLPHGKITGCQYVEQVLSTKEGPKKVRRLSQLTKLLTAARLDKGCRDYMDSVVLPYAESKKVSFADSVK
jgi:hypothetical protein